MADCLASLLVQLARDVTQTGSSLDCRDTGGVVKGDVVHVVKLQHEVAIFTTEAEVGIAMATTFRRYFDTIVSTALHCGLDMLCGEWDGDGDGDV